MCVCVCIYLSCGKTSMWQNVLWQFVLWQNVFVAKYPCGEMPCGNLSCGKMSLWQNVLRLSVQWQNDLWQCVLRTYKSNENHHFDVDGPKFLFCAALLPTLCKHWLVIATS